MTTIPRRRNQPEEKQDEHHDNKDGTIKMSEQKRYVDPITGKGPFWVDPEKRRSNILFISMDMVPREFYLQFPDAAPVQAPGIHGLKDGHVFFQNAYCASPLCSPSRAAYLTGRYPYITGNSERAHDGHEMHIREDDILFPAYLKSAGYHVRHAGKSHIGTHKYMDIFGENDSPWNRWSPPWYDDDGYLGYLRERGFERFTFERGIYGEDPSGGGTGNFYGGWVAPQRGRPFSAEMTYPAYLVRKAIQSLESRRDRNQPFYLQLDFFGPHQPFAIPSGMEEREKQIRDKLKLPRSYQALVDNGFSAPWAEPRVYRMYRKNWGLANPETLKDYRVANQLQFELMDAVLAGLFEYLKSEGLYDDTWILFIADHGEMNGRMGLIDKGAFLNPAVIQVPVILKPPSAHPSGSASDNVDQPVSLLDLAPTILKIAGVRTEERLDGFSFLDSLKGQPRPADRPILFDIWAHVIPNPSIGMVFRSDGGARYMYTFNSVDDLDELYLLDGSAELSNVFADSAHETAASEAISRMYAILERDPRWRGYADYFKLTYAERLRRPLGDRQRFL
jgi:arylsulfatase A-like enzyme